MSKAAVGDETFKAADHLSQETSVIVTGTARADARAPGGYEIDVKTLDVVGESHDYPITPKEHGVDYLLDRRHLWIRSERQQAILRVRHEIINAIRDFFNSRGFILADTPIFTPAACEGTTTLFPAQYFEDQTAYLTQSGQLYNEANAMALGRVYCFGPTFRAEKSKTRRHLTEFWMVEPEMAYADLDDVMDLAEALVVSVVARVLDVRRRELTVLERDVTKLESVKSPFPRITYDDAIRILQGAGPADRMGRRLRRSRRNDAVGGLRQARHGAPLPCRGEGVLHEAGPRAAGGRARRRRARARRIRRDRRRRRAPGGSGPAACSASRITTCRRRPSSGTSISGGTVPCPTAASVWASSGWSAGSAVSNMCARRSRIRVCCTGCIHRWKPRRSRRHGEAFVQNSALRVFVGSLPMKIGLISLGCPKNLVDSEVMLGLAREAGHELTRDAVAGRRARRQYLRVHRLGETGVDRRHPRDGAPQERRRLPAAHRDRLPRRALSRGAEGGNARDRRRARHRRSAGHRPRDRRHTGVSPLHFTGAGAPPPARTDADAFAAAFGTGRGSAWPQALPPTSTTQIRRAFSRRRGTTRT